MIEDAEPQAYVAVVLGRDTVFSMRLIVGRQGRVVLGLVVVEGAWEENRIEDCSGVLEAIYGDSLISLGSEAQ